MGRQMTEEDIERLFALKSLVDKYKRAYKATLDDLKWAKENWRNAEAEFYTFLEQYDKVLPLFDKKD